MTAARNVPDPTATLSTTLTDLFRVFAAMVGIWGCLMAMAILVYGLITG